MDLQTFSNKLKDISDKGYISTLRKGDTGIGQTLEQLLELEENNLSLPDINLNLEVKAAKKAELKAFRKNTDSMLTLFTKEPLSNLARGRDRYLLETFGYTSLDPSKEKDLYTTITALDYNSQGFKLVVKENALLLSHKTIPLDIHWPYELLKKVFEQKLPALVVVLANTRGIEFDEQFHYNEAYYLQGFNFQDFMTAVSKGYIKVDLRMHLRANNTVRNHGTAFRIVKSKLYTCFDYKLPLL
jgi:hypothetical protein|nr:MAG TPA: MvaI/BcnI restriction endonuclease family [Caudoviricetes sp.]